MVTPGLIQHAYWAEWEKPLERPLLPKEQPSPDHNPWLRQQELKGLRCWGAGMRGRAEAKRGI